MRAVEPMMRRLHDVAGTRGVERIGPDGVRLALRQLLFAGDTVPDWHSSAACREVGAEPFFVEPGPDAGWQVEGAKRVCRGCPVRAACLADVMAWERPTRRYGVAGGLSPADRQRLHLRNQAGGAR